MFERNKTRVIITSILLLLLLFASNVAAETVESSRSTSTVDAFGNPQHTLIYDIDISVFQNLDRCVIIGYEDAFVKLLGLESPQKWTRQRYSDGRSELVVPEKYVRATRFPFSSYKTLQVNKKY